MKRDQENTLFCWWYWRLMTLYHYDRVASSPVGRIKLRKKYRVCGVSKNKQQTRYYLIFSILLDSHPKRYDAMSAFLFRHSACFLCEICPLNSRICECFERHTFQAVSASSCKLDIYLHPVAWSTHVCQRLLMWYRENCCFQSRHNNLLSNQMVKWLLEDE
jgi:hypothetical protein